MQRRTDWSPSKKNTRVPKVNCLKCGSENTANINSSLDSRGRRIRERRCYDCAIFYNTVYEEGQLVATYETRLNPRTRKS